MRWQCKYFILASRENYANSMIATMKAILLVVLISKLFYTQYCAVAFVGSSFGITNPKHSNRIINQFHVKKLLKDSKDRVMKILDELDDDANNLTTSEDNHRTNESSSIFYDVTAEDNMKRLDTVVALVVARASTSALISRSLCTTLITDGHVTVNGTCETRKALKVTTGMRLGIGLDFSSTSIGGDTKNGDGIIAQDIPLSILFEDEYMIILNKAAGMVVHPAVGNRDGTVVNALAYYLMYQSKYGAGEFVVSNTTQSTDENLSFSTSFGLGIDDDIDEIPFDNDGPNSSPPFDNDGPNSSPADYELQKLLVSLRPGIVHRLDKGTTGVLVVAKTRASLAALAMQFGGGGSGSETTPRAEKTYLAITVGNPGQRVVIDRPIGRHPIYRQRMRVVPDPTQNSFRRNTKGRPNTIGGSSTSQKGRRALSFVDTIAFDGKLAFVKVRIETGRTHQIRVHLQDRHTPIYGDDVYGISDWNKRLNKTYGISRPMLHAFRLKLQHPISGESMTFQAPLPDDMQKLVRTIYPQGEDEDPDIFVSNT
jgi:23S rRNA-/tRNA-specific pseudouridylate synthase